MPLPTIQLRRQQYVHPFGHELAELNPDTVVEMLDYLYNTTSWKSNPDALRRKVSQTRMRLFKDSPGTLSTGATPHTADNLFVSDEARAANLLAVISETQGMVPPRVLTDDPDPDAWIERGIALRMEGAGWTRLAKELEKPRATLRRVIAKEMDERGLVAPSTAGDD